MAHISGKLLCLPATAASPSTNRGCSSSLLARTSAAATMERNLLKEKYSRPRITLHGHCSYFRVVLLENTGFFSKHLTCYNDSLPKLSNFSENVTIIGIEKLSLFL